METTTVRIAVEDGEEEIELPAGVLEVLGEGGQASAETVGDLLAVDCTHRLHGLVHHGDGEPDPRARELEGAMRESFEDRFGASFAELTGHEH